MLTTPLTGGVFCRRDSPAGTPFGLADAQHLAAPVEARQLGLAPDGKFQAAHDALRAGGTAAPAPQPYDDCHVEDRQHSENACIDHVHISN